MPRGRKPISRSFVEKARGGRLRAAVIPDTIDGVLDRVMAAQRPAVLAHLSNQMTKHPLAENAEIVALLERRYLAVVTATGAAAGAVAVLPAVGTVSALALSGAETVAFLEATALFAQSVAELYGLTVDDPDRARAFVLALLLGSEGSAIVREFGRELVDKDATRTGYWAELIATGIPQAVVLPLLGRLKNTVVKRLAAREGATILGRALPYGVGALVGGIGNNLMGRRVIHSSREAFGIG
ncbi:hypothetical protein [Gryllotalpicola sp.]|uniref:hypothetical protein n=1 Tax=Gryllotalpicola sp. TaxID=1932787 RepID=UPI0026397648|nr:hypothetical protein [Gryllotalpicola sp.]